MRLLVYLLVFKRKFTQRRGEHRTDTRADIAAPDTSIDSRHGAARAPNRGLATRLNKGGRTYSATRQAKARQITHALLLWIIVAHAPATFALRRVVQVFQQGVSMRRTLLRRNIHCLSSSLKSSRS